MSNRRRSEGRHAEAVALDRVASEFEDEWRRGAHPRIEEYVTRHTDLRAELLLRELISVEIELRSDSGESPTSAEYCSRFPDRRGVVLSCFTGDAGGRTDNTYPTVAMNATLCPACGAALDIASDPTASGQTSDYDSSHHGRFLPGTKIVNRYRIVSLLGKGGMGEVYRADDLKLGHTVALKFLPRGLSQNAKLLDYFHNEVRLARQISHPNVCRVYDIGDVGGQQFLSMEYIDGEDLKVLLRRIGKLPKDKGTEIAQQLCAGLAAAHDRGVLHRDLKPANIMLDGRGQVRITDFGLARLVDDAAESELVGTPAYMAPEQLARGQTTIQSDLYSLGLILYELFTGRPLHKTNSVPELLEQQQELSDSQPLTDQEMDPVVARAIARCLEREAYQRPVSAHEVAAALPGGDPLAVAIASGETPSPQMVAAAGDKTGLRPRTAGAVFATTVACLLLVVLLSSRTSGLDDAQLVFEPAVLADEVREIVSEDFGYPEVDGHRIHGFDWFRESDSGRLRFWYRWRPYQADFGIHAFWTAWGHFSRARPSFAQPSWHEPGEYGVLLDGNKKLHFFRALAPAEIMSDRAATPPQWSEWFKPERTGYYLVSPQSAPPSTDLAADIEALEPVTDRWRTPPDVFDQLGVWKSVDSDDGRTTFVQAAAFRGRPTYFRTYTEEEFEASSLDDGAVATGLQYGRVFVICLYATLLGAGFVLAWQNMRQGRGDRRGARRLATYLFIISATVWLTYCRHTADIGAEIGNVFTMGLAQVLFDSARIWLWYMALEPFVRRVWPQILISSSRLLNGQLRDPLIGRDLLIGIAFGSMSSLLWKLNHLGQEWLEVGSRPVSALNPIALSGLRELFGSACAAHTVSFLYAFLVLMLLVVCRMIFATQRQAVIASLVTIAVAITLLRGGPPLLTLLPTIVHAVLLLFVLVRFGILALVVQFTTIRLIESFPLTFDPSRWYFGHGMFAMMVVAAVLIYGFSTALGRGRPTAGHAAAF